MLLAMLIIFPSTAAVSFAEGGEIVEEGACGTYSTYTLDESGLLTIGGAGSVNSNAFFGRKDIKALEVGDRITSFGTNVFNGCSELATITLGEKVKSIGDKAFYGVAAETIELPDSVTTMGVQVFADSGLKNLTLGDGLRSVNWNIISGCHLEELTVYSYKLTLSINIPSNTKVYAFHNSYAMEFAVQMDMNCEALDEHEFEVLYTDPSTCGKDGFTVELCSCGEYATKVIPATEHVDANSDNVCDNCEKYLGVNCDHDYELSVTKPTCTKNGEVLMICKLCFDEQEAEIEATGHEYKTCDEGIKCALCGELFEETPDMSGSVMATGSCGSNATYTILDSGELIINGSGKIERDKIGGWGFFVKSIIINGQITEIGESVFDNFNYVTDVKINSTVLKKIGKDAFSSCTSLKSINIPASVEEIGENAFSGDTKLESFNFPSGLKIIGKSAFYQCAGIKGNIVFDNIASIGENAFRNCSLIESIRIEPLNCSIGNFAIPQSIIIIGHKDSTAKSYAENFGNTFDQIEAEEGACGEAKYTLYNDGTLHIYGTGEAGFFRNDVRIKKVIVDNGVTALSKLCFSGCTNLKEVSLPDSLTKIGDNAFEYCTIDTLVIPDSVEEIGKYALKGTVLNKLVMGSKAISIDSKTFQYAEVKTLEVRNTSFDPTVGSFRNAVIYAPHKSAAYKYALDWGNEFYFNDSHNLVTLTESQATCGAYGERFVYCTSCDFYEIQKIDTLSHTDLNDDKICDNCGKLLHEICEHNWVIDYTADTCGVDGICRATCTLCSKITEAQVTATRHAGVTYLKGYVPATTKEEGYTGDKYCLLCDEKISDGNVIKKIDDSEIIAYRAECIEKLQQLIDKAKHETSIEKLETAIDAIRPLEDMDAITSEYDSAVAEFDYYEELLSSAANNAIDEIEKAAGKTRSDVIQFIVDKAEKDINAATNENRVESIKSECLESIKTQLEKEAAAALKEAKASAKQEISNAMATCKHADSYQVLTTALKAIDTKKTVEDVEKTKNDALSFVGALEKELADAKTTAIDEINAAKTNASYAIAEKAVTDINTASTVEDVNAIKTQALADMAKADEEAAYAKALTDAKDEALEAVDAAKEAALNYAVENISVDAILNATTLEEVAIAKKDALDAIAVAEKELADAKTAAISAVNAEAGKDASNAVKAIVSKATTGINDEHRVSRVEVVKDDAIEAIKTQKAAEKAAAEAKALADAKSAAIAEIKALIKSDSTNDEKALVNETIKVINSATSVKAVDDAKADFYAKWNELHKEDPSENCGHLCHQKGFMGFIWKLTNFFNKLFGINKVCKCGKAHY